uniref:Uncharacterized protein n=1 Tax=Arundo donax TaxID=35708 RepID=A0A0A8Z1X3_ARUDO
MLNSTSLNLLSRIKLCKAIHAIIILICFSVG